MRPGDEGSAATGLFADRPRLLAVTLITLVLLATAVRLYRLDAPGVLDSHCVETARHEAYLVYERCTPPDTSERGNSEAP